MSPSRILAAALLLPTLLVAQRAGPQERTLESGGDQREYILHLPRGFKKSKKKTVPLVLMLHGRTSNGRAAASTYYGWSRLADKEGFLAVFPTALGKPTSWQAAFRGRPTADSKFLAELIDLMIEEFNVDKDRVFMTGHSSGGFMSYSFATTHADKVAAIGPVAGLAISTKAPAKPVSVISFHGMADNVVAYDSKNGARARYGRGMPSAMDSAAGFAKHNGGSKKPERTDLHKGKVHVDRWVNGKAGTRVELYSIEGWGHGWPTSRSKVAATELIWKFFQKHAREPAQGKKTRKGKRL